jgi:hypothetical protein
VKKDDVPFSRTQCTAQPRLSCEFPAPLIGVVIIRFLEWHRIQTLSIL